MKHASPLAPNITSSRERHLASRGSVLLDAPRAIALILLLGICGYIIWSFHNYGWMAAMAVLLVGGFLGLMVGGAAGVHLFPTFEMMAAMGGLFEGVYQGWSYYGYIGAIVGGMIGFVAAVTIGLVPLMIVHLVLLLRGVDPPIESNGK